MKIKYLIIHHTATSRDHTTFESIKRGHIRRGWGDIGYHFFITAYGILKEGRGQDKVGTHCKADGMNFKSLGICLSGNFQVEKPKNKQLDTLKGIIKQLQKIYSVPLENILAHREVKGAKTLCCGKNLIPYIKEIRNLKPKSDLSETVKEQTGEIKQLKFNLKKCQDKCQKKQELINKFKEKEKKRQTWFNKLFS